MSTPRTFYWFDYETFGISPAWDKPAQFAGIRTDEQLNIIEEPLLIYCKPPKDYLPDPRACRVTGMHPTNITERGLLEPDFIKQVVTQLGQPGTCAVGFNNLRFDDEFTRFTLFRNFHDAYQHEWKNGNSRWDLLDVVRMARALRPEGINWPTDAEGKASNRLELLTKANDIEHGNAHDALADVYATIAVAKLLQDAQPKLYHYAYNNKDKQSVSSLLDVETRRPCLHISGMVPSEFGHTSIVMPIARHPVNNNGIIVLDLRTDPNELANLSAETIAKRVFSSNDALGDQPRIHLRTLQINRCPVLAPLGTLRPADAQRLNISLDEQLARATQLDALLTSELVINICQAMQGKWDSEQADTDGSLYSGGFLNGTDKRQCEKVRRYPAERLQELNNSFHDERYNVLLFRYRARNYPQTLSPKEQTHWQTHCAKRLLAKEAPWLNKRHFFELMDTLEWRPEEETLRLSLLEHADNVLTGLELDEPAAIS